MELGSNICGWLKGGSRGRPAKQRGKSSRLAETLGSTVCTSGSSSTVLTQGKSKSAAKTRLLSKYTRGSMPIAPTSATGRNQHMPHGNMRAQQPAGAHRGQRMPPAHPHARPFPAPPGCRGSARPPCARCSAAAINSARCTPAFSWKPLPRFAIARVLRYSTASDCPEPPALTIAAPSREHAPRLQSGQGTIIVLQRQYNQPAETQGATIRLPFI